MRIHLSVTGIAGDVRIAVALVAAFISLSNAGHFPANVRAVLLATSGVLITVEHALDGLGNNTKSAAPAEAAAPVVTIAPEVLAAAQQIVAAATAAGIVATGSPTAAGQA